MDMTIKDMERSLYEFLMQKLYHFFVVERKEARVDTVVQILTLLRPSEVLGKEIEEDSKSEEVDII